MGLIRAFKDAGATLHRERDERIELLQLRKGRDTYRVVGLVALFGTLAVLAWPSLADHQRVLAMWWVLVATYLAWVGGRIVAQARHGSSATPEMQRADALRSLLLFPLGLPVSGVVYWLLSRDIAETLIWLAMFGTVMVVALAVRYYRFAPPAEDES